MTLSIHAYINSSFQQPVHTRCKSVWCHAHLANSRFNRKPQIGMHEPIWQSCSIDPWLIWLPYLQSWAWSAVTKAMISWVNHRQHANRHRLHKSDDHSLAIVVQCCFKLLYNHTSCDYTRLKPLCWERQCAIKFGLILASTTCTNTFFWDNFICPDKSVDVV